MPTRSQPSQASAVSVSTKAPRRAIVVGASMAGLLAAHVLRRHVDEVVLLERDELPDGPGQRKGTPHANHAHGLLARGLQGLEAFFPGIGQELLAQGAVGGDVLSGVPFMVGSHRFASRPVGTMGLAVSRALLEATVRRRVIHQPGIHLRTGVHVPNLLCDDKRCCVIGVRLQHLVPSSSQDDTLFADWVVDATGRGSRLPSWLRDMGYPEPEEARVQVDVAYATAYFERHTDAAHQVGVLLCATPDQPRSGVLLAQEPLAGAESATPRWVLTQAGYKGDHPSPTLAGMRERARQCGVPEWVELTRHGQLMGDVASYRFTHSQRRHYERLHRFPHGLLAMGDALASFNPTYGQGMTVAVCEAEALDQALRRKPQHLAGHFFAQAAKIIDAPWQMTHGGDLALPMVPGHRPWPVRLVNAYMARLFKVAAVDVEAAKAFVEVAHLLQPPSSLFAPRMLWRVLRPMRKTRPSAALAST